MNFNELSKMQARWPEETPSIIGAREPRKKDYGSATPVPSMLSRAWQSVNRHLASKVNRKGAILTVSVCGVVAACLLTFYAILPTAIDGLIAHQRQVVIDSRYGDTREVGK